MMLMTPSVPATSISRRSRVPSKTLMLALFHAKQVIPEKNHEKFHYSNDFDLTRKMFVPPAAIKRHAPAKENKQSKEVD